MDSLLNLSPHMFIELQCIKNDKKSLFRCEDVIHYQNQYNYNCNRYILSNLDDISISILDVVKTEQKDIKITHYYLLEKMEFDLNFLSLIGTSPLGYHHPHIKNIDYILYELIEKDECDVECIKYIVTEDELPKNPKAKGYSQDGNGNWYFLANRSNGSLIKFDNGYKQSWEYKQSDGERLLIEMDAKKSMQQYLDEKPFIYIYEGKALKRKDIKILHTQKELEMI